MNVWDQSGAQSRVRADATGRYGISVAPGGIDIALYPPTPTSAYLEHEFHLDIPETPYEIDLEFLRPNVAGRVVTADGLPVRDAQIQAFGPTDDGPTVRYATTDRQGRFGLRLAPGTTQRVVATPAVSSPAGIRTATYVEVPGEDEVEERRDRARARTRVVVRPGADGRHRQRAGRRPARHPVDQPRRHRGRGPGLHRHL